MFTLRKHITPHSIFWKYCPFILPGHCWKWKFLSAYSSFFLHTRRIRGKYLNTYGECAESVQAYSEITRKVFMRKRRKWQIGVICGTQNHLRIRGKYLNALGEYAERIYAYMEKTQRDSWRILLIRQKT